MEDDRVMGASNRLETVARSLVSQRLALAPIDVLEHMRPRDEAEAYAVQVEVNRELSKSPLGAPIGHKIGCTTPVMRAYLGISTPCAGEIFGATVVENEGRVSCSAFRRLGVECEIVIRLARDVEPGAAPLDRETAASCVGSVLAGIEIVDDRYQDYPTLGAPTLIADNFFNAGCVLGDPVSDWRQLNLVKLAGRMLINDREVGRGDGAMILDHPFDALAWLANSRASRGLGLRKGAIVFLGSLVETKWLNPGDTAHIEIEGLGTVGLMVSA
jgi:2-keto-4-pentenoate hydratase